MSDDLHGSFEVDRIATVGEKQNFISVNSTESNTALLAYEMNKIENSKSLARNKKVYNNFLLRPNWTWWIPFFAIFFTLTYHFASALLLRNSSQFYGAYTISSVLSFMCAFLSVVGYGVLSSIIRSIFNVDNYIKETLKNDLLASYGVNFTEKSLSTPEGLGKLLSMLQALSNNEVSARMLKEREHTDDFGVRIHNFADILLDYVKKDGFNINVCEYFTNYAIRVYVDGYNKDKTRAQIEKDNKSLEVLWSN